MARYDHSYVNLPSTLMEVVDICVSMIFKNGAQIYKDKKDFVMKAIQNQIEFEKARTTNLEKRIEKFDIGATINKQFNNKNATRGGNSRKNV